MSATRDLSMECSEERGAFLGAAPRSTLVPCRAGSDRTGLACVEFLQQVEGVDGDIAEKRKSLVFGHVGPPFLRAYAMERSWEALEKTPGIKSREEPG